MEALPVEIMEQIILLLDIQSIQTMFSVCKLYHNLKCTSFVRHLVIQCIPKAIECETIKQFNSVHKVKFRSWWKLYLWYCNYKIDPNDVMKLIQNGNFDTADLILELFELSDGHASEIFESIITRDLIEFTRTKTFEMLFNRYKDSVKKVMDESRKRLVDLFGVGSKFGELLNTLGFAITCDDFRKSYYASKQNLINEEAVVPQDALFDE